MRHHLRAATRSGGLGNAVVRDGGRGHAQGHHHADGESGRGDGERHREASLGRRPAAVAIAVTMPADTWLPTAPPMLRTIVFMPVAMPVCCGGTASMIRFAIDAKAKPMPMPITSMAT